MLSDLAELRRVEFPLLYQRGIAYLDYTGAALPPKSVLDAHRRMLDEHVFGNPHSAHDASRTSSDAIDRARARVLRFMDADPAEYVVCFTANTSAAIKLVAEGFDFGRNGSLLLSADNHNSVNGIREYARRAGATTSVLPLTTDLRLDPRGPAGAFPNRGSAAASGTTGLFAFPAQSNFSGVKHPLSLVAEAQAAGFTVLVDAAAYLPANALSLRTIRPDFVALSLYKILGYPTGVGALVARRDALARLTRPWFAGGAVEWASVVGDRHRLRDGAEGFEDGTPNYLALAAVEAGFDFVDRVGMDRIGAHVGRLTEALLESLSRARHRNGRPMFEVHGPTDMSGRGGAVAFNVFDDQGRVIPYEWVETGSTERGVMLRGGCFCNPGASEAAFGLEGRPLMDCFDRQAGVRFAPQRLRDCVAARAVGALRASVGIATTLDDVLRAVEVVMSLAGDSREAVA